MAFLGRVGENSSMRPRKPLPVTADKARWMSGLIYYKLACYREETLLYQLGVNRSACFLSMSALHVFHAVLWIKEKGRANPVLLPLHPCHPELATVLPHPNKWQQCHCLEAGPSTPAGHSCQKRGCRPRIKSFQKWPEANAGPD